VVLLRCCSAHEAFLRTYRREPDESLAAEFLVLDRLFPRSIFSALASAEACLVQLDPSSNRAGTRDEARRLLGLARARLEYRGIDELLSDLPAHLRAVQNGCRLASEATAARYFRQAAIIEWNQEGSGLTDIDLGLGLDVDVPLDAGVALDTGMNSEAGINSEAGVAQP
jgi:uncharacterized alpha-E superfamily protein